MWIPEVPVLEKVVRAAVGYVFLLVVFRVMGKRQVGQLTPFDLVVLLIVSNVLQNAMIGPDDSITGGLIGVLTIFLLNGTVARLTFRYPRLEQLIDGIATPLVRDGTVDDAALKRELVTRAELCAALREHGIEQLDDVRWAMLESTGKITAAARDE